MYGLFADESVAVTICQRLEPTLLYEIVFCSDVSTLLYLLALWLELHYAKHLHIYVRI
jgi:hypothetical protein